MPGSGALTAAEIAAIREAIGFRLAGETDGLSEAAVADLQSAHAKLGAAPPRACWLPFSLKDLGLLVDALRNGAEGVLQPSAGTRPDEKKAFREAANRILDAGKFRLPRF